MFDIRAFRDGDARQLATVFTQWYPTLCRYAARFLPAHADAEDIVMDSLLYCWAHRERVKNQHHIKALLCISIRNNCSNYRRHLEICRKAHLEITCITDAVTPDPYWILDCTERVGELMKALDEIPPRQTQIFRLAYLDNRSIADIARSLHLSCKTVLNQRRLTVKKLEKIGK